MTRFRLAALLLRDFAFLLFGSWGLRLDLAARDWGWAAFTGAFIALWLWLAFMDAHWWTSPPPRLKYLPGRRGRRQDDRAHLPAGRVGRRHGLHKLSGQRRPEALHADLGR
jgi:hypothetical protein